MGRLGAVLVGSWAVLGGPKTAQERTRPPKLPPRAPKILPRGLQDPKKCSFGLQNRPKIHPKTSPEPVENRKAEKLDFRQPSHGFGGFYFPKTDKNPLKILIKLLPQTACKPRPEKEEKCTPKSSPGGPGDPPGRPQDGPRLPQDGPRQPQDGPRTAPRRPEDPSGSPQDGTGPPKTPKDRPKTPPRPPQDRF